MKQDEKTYSYQKFIWIILSVTIGLLWWHGLKDLPSKPQKYHLAHQEAKKIVTQVLADFNLKPPVVRMGHYPLLGTEFNQQAIFPLLHTPCPIAQGCNRVISDLKVALLRQGYQLLDSIEIATKDRPFYYAIAKNNQPVMALRMIPTLSYSTLVLNVDQSSYLDIQSLLHMNAHLSFVIDQKSSQGRKVYDHLSLAGRELYLKVDLSSLSLQNVSINNSIVNESQPTATLQKILKETGEIIRTHIHFRGIF